MPQLIAYRRPDPVRIWEALSYSDILEVCGTQETDRTANEGTSYNLRRVGETSY